jgi:YD repeat-containing protein
MGRRRCLWCIDYDYDAANRRERADFSTAYDILNRQTVVTNTAAITTEYIYDARGRRMAKVSARGVLGSAGVTITHYLYDIEYRVLEERDGAGQLLARYTLRQAQGRPTAPASTSR